MFILEDNSLRFQAGQELDDIHRSGDLSFRSAFCLRKTYVTNAATKRNFFASCSLALKGGNQFHTLTVHIVSETPAKLHWHQGWENLTFISVPVFVLPGEGLLNMLGAAHASDLPCRRAFLQA